MNTQLTDISNFLISPPFIIVWCLLIVFYTLKSFFYIHWKKKVLYHEITETIRIVRQTRDGKGFAQAFTDVSARIMMLHRIRLAWKEFSSSIFFPDYQTFKEDSNSSPWGEQVPVKMAMRSTHLPSRYLNESTIIYPFIELNPSRISSHLHILGLMGTLVALAAAIFLSKNGLLPRPENGSAQTPAYLPYLPIYKGAALAFSSSILGLLCALFYQYTHRLDIKEILGLIENLNHSLIARLDIQPIEKMLDSSTQAIRQQLKITYSLLEEMKNFTTKHQSHFEPELFQHWLHEFRQKSAELSTENLRTGGSLAKEKTNDKGRLKIGEQHHSRVSDV
ncbi:MAG: hypothetical protein KA436_07265 [Oligoflexales bacterium]|nr:hypothetical protein [Oligoflexales bacterium]